MGNSADNVPLQALGRLSNDTQTDTVVQGGEYQGVRVWVVLGSSATTKKAADWR